MRPVTNKLFLGHPTPLGRKSLRKGSNMYSKCGNICVTKEICCSSSPRDARMNERLSSICVFKLVFLLYSEDSALAYATLLVYFSLQHQRSKLPHHLRMLLCDQKNLITTFKTLHLQAPTSKLQL